MAWLIAVGLGISPRVEASEPGLVTVDLRGVLDRGLVGLQVAEQSRRAGIVLCAGISTTPDRARWASFRGRSMFEAPSDEELFAGLGLEEVPLPVATRKSLAEWGVKDLWAFVSFTKEEVGRRLDREAVTLWEAMKGRSCRVLRVVEEKPIFQVGMSLENRVETLAQALFVIRRLLDEVCSSLEAAGRVARSLELTWHTDSNTKGGHVFSLPEATARTGPLFAMMESHLSGVRTDEALKYIGLRAIPQDPLAEQGDFFEVSAASPFSFQETVGRIHGLVGKDRVGVPVKQDSYHPDAFGIDPPPTRFRAEEEKASYARSVGPALRRFRPSRSVRVWCRKGRPAFCKWKTHLYRIESVSGPWRMSGNWWDPQNRWAWEEWDVEWEQHSFCRLSRNVNDEWFWDGIYD